MPRLRRLPSLLICALALSLVGAVSASGASAAAKAPSGSLDIDDSTPPASLDPAAVCSLEDIGLLSDLYVTLVKHKVVGAGLTQHEDSTKIVPYLADSWKITGGGKIYTFKLHPGAKFPSGKPIDSAAVKFSWERAIKVGSCGNFFLQANGANLVKTIATPDASTVVVTLGQPQINFLQALTGSPTAIVDPSVLRAHGSTAEAQNQWLASGFAGSGPYLLSAYTPGTSAVYTANPTFFGIPARTKTVTINFVSSDPTLLLRTRSGQNDIALGLAKQSVASLAKSSKVKIVDTSAATWQLVSFPISQPPFDNAKLRRALTYAVPYTSILQKVAFGYGKLFYGPFPPAFAEYDAKLDGPRVYNLATAKQLLAASGVKTPIKLAMYTRQGVADQQQIATIVQASWKPLGIDVTIKQLSAAQYQTAVSAKKKTYSLVRFDGPSIPNPGWLLGYDSTCGSPFNMSNYCNSASDKLLGQALTTTNSAARQLIWNKIVKLWVAAAPRVPIYAQDYTAVVKSDITHYVYAQDDLLFHLWGR